MKARCRVCGRKLTNQESIDRGAGTTCAVHTLENIPKKNRDLEYEAYREKRLTILKKKKHELTPRIIKTHYLRKEEMKRSLKKHLNNQTEGLL